MAKNIEVYVKGKKLSMNDFVASVVNDVMMALLRNLRDVDIKTISKIEVE